METKENDAGPNVQEMQAELGKLKTDLATRQTLAHEREQKMLALQKASDHDHSTLEHIKADLEASTKAKSEWRHKARLAEDAEKELRIRINARATADNKAGQKIEYLTKLLDETRAQNNVEENEHDIISAHLSEMLGALREDRDSLQTAFGIAQGERDAAIESREELEKKHIALIVGCPESEVHKLSVTPAQARQIIEGQEQKRTQAEGAHLAEGI